MLLLTAHFGGAWSNWGAKHGAYSVRLIAYTLAPAVLIGSIYARIRLDVWIRHSYDADDSFLLGCPR